MILESQIKKIMDKLEAEGRVTTLTVEETAKIDNALAEKLDYIKEDYNRLERKSEAYMLGKYIK